MSKSKKANTLVSNRRQFLTHLAAGSAATVGLSSCQLEDIPFLKDKAKLKGPPSQKDIDALLEATEEISSAIASLDKLKKNFLRFKNYSTDFAPLVSEEAFKKVIDDQTIYLTNFYKDNFTAGEVKDLIKIYNSKVWQKLLAARLANTPSSADKPNMPLAKFMLEMQTRIQKQKVENKS